MSGYRLRQQSFIRLQAQLNLTGKFHLTLEDTKTQAVVYGTITTERTDTSVRIDLRMGDQHHSLTLPSRSRNNATTVAQWLEGIANGLIETAEFKPTRRWRAAA
ncbi:hypothetical protein [Pseudomonas aeruginosa]|nr:hypothetical protein [Pseudomonas aeruginosa]